VGGGGKESILISLLKENRDVFNRGERRLFRVKKEESPKGEGACFKKKRESFLELRGLHAF